MKLLRKILPSLLLVLAVVACQRQSWIIEVFGLVENQPDSALLVLSQIDRGGLSDDELAEWGLAYCWALDRSEVDVTSYLEQFFALNLVEIFNFQMDFHDIRSIFLNFAPQNFEKYDYRQRQRTEGVARLVGG